LLVGHFVRDQRKALAFAAGAGSRGDRDERKHRPDGFADALIVLHPPAIGQQEVGAFGGVHAAAAAQADNAVDLCRAGCFQAVVHVARGWVLRYAVVNGDSDIRIFERLNGPTDMPGGNDTSVRYDQNSPATDLSCQPPKRINNVYPKNET